MIKYNVIMPTPCPFKTKSFKCTREKKEQVRNVYRHVIGNYVEVTDNVWGGGREEGRLQKHNQIVQGQQVRNLRFQAKHIVYILKSNT